MKLEVLDRVHGSSPEKNLHKPKKPAPPALQQLLSEVPWEVPSTCLMEEYHLGTSTWLGAMEVSIATVVFWEVKGFFWVFWVAKII